MIPNILDFRRRKAAFIPNQICLRCLATTFLQSTLAAYFDFSKHREMPFSSIPAELILCIADLLDSQDLNSFVPTNSTCYQTLNPLLYRRNIPKALTGVICTTSEPTVQKCLDHGANLNSSSSTTDGITPFVKAILFPNDEAAMLLPKRGADPETVDRQTLAVSAGHLRRTFSTLLGMGIYDHGKANEVLRLASQAGNEDQQGCCLTERPRH
jgi:hypothetical protein